MATVVRFSCKLKRDAYVVDSKEGEARANARVFATIDRMNHANITIGGRRLPQKRGYVKKRIFQDVKGYLKVCARTLKELVCSRELCARGECFLFRPEENGN